MIALLAAVLTATVPLSTPPARTDQCVWVRGRFVVANGSGIQRIWIIGTHRIVHLYDDVDDVPPAVGQYEQAHGGTGEGLYGDFHICAREPSRPGRMQHVRMTGARRLIYDGKPWPSIP